MVELIIFFLCSVLIARCLEKRYKIASMAHAVLFVFLGLVWVFTSEIELIEFAARNMVGDFYYEVLKEALTERMTMFHLGFSALLMAEAAIYMTIAIASIVIFFKGLKKLGKLIKFNDRPLAASFGFAAPAKPILANAYPGNRRDTYLETRRLRN